MVDRAQVQDIIRARVEQLIAEATTGDKLLEATAKHRDKIHFIPAHYRVLGGVLQAMNIKFGNFIEDLLHDLARLDPQVDLHEKSGRKLTLRISARSDQAIDAYITARQQPGSSDTCDDAFAALVADCLAHEADAPSGGQTQQKDVDLLFTAAGGQVVYSEVKYNDDHDTGKFVDINRKFIKTYIGLSNALGIHDVAAFRPVIYYFNPTKRWGPLYVPTAHILRGEALFREYFRTRFEDVDETLRDISNDPVVIGLFDDLAARLRPAG